MPQLRNTSVVAEAPAERGRDGPVQISLVPRKRTAAETGPEEELEKSAKVTGLTVGRKTLKRRADAAWDTSVSKCSSAEEAAEVLKRLLARAEKEWPGVTSAVSQAAAGPAAMSSDCDRCKRLLTGLSNLAPLQGDKLSVPYASVRRHLDGLVRQEFTSSQQANEQGYSIGRARWAAAANPEEPVHPGGRPSMVNKASVIAMVKKALDERSQPSSNICKKDAEWVVAHSLTDTKTEKYNSSADVHMAMSESTFMRVLKQHHTEYKRPRAVSDYCQHCSDLDTKVLPAIRSLLQEHRAALEGLMPSYFAAFDTHAAQADLSFETQPGLYVKEIEHYIARHCESRPCAKHAGSNFPCGLLSLRKRGSGFCQRYRLDLHENEAAAGHVLRSHLKLLLAYLHHRNAKDLQHAALTDLLECPPVGTAVLLSDHKELETIPQSWRETGDMFFAQARQELSIWGALLVEHDQGSTAATPKILRTHMLFVSNILVHTALRTNQLIRLALAKRKSAAPWERLCLVSDCGPHYRSLESLAHHLITLHQQFSIPVEVHFGCEKHLKSGNISSPE